MELCDVVIFSVDDHVIEPRNLFEEREPAKFKGRFPRIRDVGSGAEAWTWEGSSIEGSVGLNAVVTWPREQWDFEPTSHAEMRPGCYQLDARIDDMNVNGVGLALNFPTFARFGGNYFGECADKDLAYAAVRAYNDWHLEEWCAPHPDRMIPLAIPVSWDGELAAEEVRRCARNGFASVCFTENPSTHYGLPSIHSGYWDPFFKACQDLGMPISIHIGSRGGLPLLTEDASRDAKIVLGKTAAIQTLLDFVFSDVFVKFPSLKIALSEGGAGWIPYVLERMDRHAENQTWTGHRFTADERPSDCYRDHFLCCIVGDPAALAMRDRIGFETMAVEIDFPHSDSLWPNAPEFLMAEFEDAGLSDQEIDGITWKNAATFYGIDPFERMSRRELSVGGLRADAAHVDTSTTSKAEYRARYEAQHAPV